MKWALLSSDRGSVIGTSFRPGLLPEIVIVEKMGEANRLAKQHGVTFSVMPRQGEWSSKTGCSPDRLRYTDSILNVIRGLDVDFVVMLGFMVVLGPQIGEGALRFVNTHPSLLPAFKGDRAVRDALAAGVETTGCTQHIATGSVDDGPYLHQTEVAVLPNDTEASLHERIKEVERRVIPPLIEQILTGTIDLEREWKKWLETHRERMMEQQPHMGD